jgi:hypothetical protein
VDFEVVSSRVRLKGRGGSLVILLEMANHSRGLPEGNKCTHNQLRYSRVCLIVSCLKRCSVIKIVRRERGLISAFAKNTYQVSSVGAALRSQIRKIMEFIVWTHITIPGAESYS